MLEYVVQLTRDATQIGPGHHDRLRAAGFDDRGILQITLIASWFNYINRVADALGVGRAPRDTRSPFPPRPSI
jgi:alkylhydroperoxidase family enzyme